MKIGIFGGTFNPIHNGHMSLCAACVEQYSLDKLLLIPANIPPHKKPKNLASGKDRLIMAQLAADEYNISCTADAVNSMHFIKKSKLEVSNIELLRSEKSYTIHTLEILENKYPNDEIFLIIGSDMLLTFSQWFRYEDILKIATVIAGGRFLGDNSCDNKEMRDEQKRLNDKFAKAGGHDCVLLADLPITVLSSTDIRFKIKSGIDVSELLPNSVLKYINQKNLYK